MDFENASVRGTPLGCMIGFLAIIPLCVAAAGGYGLWIWSQLPEPKKAGGPPGLLTSSLYSGLGIGIPVLIFSFWIHVKSRSSR